MSEVVVVLKRRGTIRHTLMPGLVLVCDPIGGAEIDFATDQARAHCRMIAEGSDATERYGIHSDAPALLLANTLQVGPTIIAIELALRHVRAWEGVGDDQTPPRPVDLSPAGLAMLFNEWAPWEGKGPRRTFGEVFLSLVHASQTLEPAAKNGSTVSPGGSTGEAVNTAGSAG